MFRKCFVLTTLKAQKRNKAKSFITLIFCHNSLDRKLKLLLATNDTCWDGGNSAPRYWAISKKTDTKWNSYTFLELFHKLCNCSIICERVLKMWNQKVEQVLKPESGSL